MPDSATRSGSLADAVIDNTSVMVVLLDHEGRILRFNHACELVSGYSASEVMGKHPWDTVLPPEDADVIKREAFDALAASPTAGKSQYTNYWLTRNGERRLIEWTNNTFVDQHGQMQYIVAVGIDVSARKHAEQELLRHREHLEDLVRQRTAELEQESRRNALIVNAAMDGFFVADMQGRIRDCNDIYCRILGYSQDELLKLRIPEIEAIETADDVARHIQKIIAQGQDRFDTRHRRKDGSLVDVEVNVTLAEVGGERLFFAFVHDISQRKQAEQDLIKARDEAERSNAAKSEFLSRMSHELRTPLNAILGFGQLLEQDTSEPLMERQATGVQEILRAGNHLLDMVNEVLDLARIESGHLNINLEPVNIAPVIDACVVQMQPQAQERGITIHKDTSVNCTARADLTRLKQILLNLISNAIKYNRENGSVHVQCLTTESGRLRVSIRDTGLGIEENYIDLIFRPFERLESSYAGIEGTGIGLALAKRLIEAMHGSIGVESTAGRGSTFWFELPLSAGNAEPVNPEHQAIPPDATQRSRVHHRILYIEDNPSNLKLMQQILARRDDLELLAAETANQGLDVANSEHPNLILLDINLPDMDGFAALKLLKENPVTRDIPVIAITANAMPRDIERGRAAQFAGYLTKPLDIPELLATLERCLARTDS